MMMAKDLPKVVGHRGCAYVSENTLAAIHHARELGVRVFEIDVWMTLDRHIVVTHDNTTERVRRYKLPENIYTVEKSTLEQLRSIDVGNDKYPNQKIPTLWEVLEDMKFGEELLIEVKSKNKKIVPKLIDVLKQSKKHPDEYAVISFSAPILEALKLRAPETRTLWLTGKEVYLPNIEKPIISKITKRIPKSLIFGLDASKSEKEDIFRIFQWASKVIEDAKKINVNGLDIDAGKEQEGFKGNVALNYALIHLAQEDNMIVSAWTVNDPRRAKDLALLGVDYITTDYPDKIIPAIQEMHANRGRPFQLLEPKVINLGSVQQRAN
jgi:glycerophosphoryl diester phosphodiesterase